MREKFKKPKNNLGADSLFFNNPLAYIDEKGRFIYKASGFFRLEKIYGASYGIAGEVSRPLDFDTVYKWPNLKRDGYELISEPNEITICGGGKVTRIDNALSFKDIEIKFNNRKDLVNLCSYIDDKKSSLEIFINVASVLSEQGEIDFANEQNNYLKIKSEKISSLLSFGSTFIIKNKSMEVKGGDRYIFESDELIDQLTISTLLYFAKKEHIPSHNILIALLLDGLKKFLRSYTENIDEYEKDILTNEALELISLVILNKNKRFVFNPNNRQSLQHYFFGTGHPVTTNKGGWIPKIQEYLKDKNLEKHRLKEEATVVESRIEDKDYDKIYSDWGAFLRMDQSAQTALIKDKTKDWPAKDRDILYMHYLEGSTLEDIGKKYGVKKARISQILNKLVKKLGTMH